MAKYGGGFGGGMNMQAMMQQAKKLQEQMAAAEAELEDTELTGEAGGGLVSVTIDGKKRLQRLSNGAEMRVNAERKMTEFFVQKDGAQSRRIC